MLPMPLLLSAWVHNLDPYMIKLWEGGPIRWYGMAYLLAFVVGWFLIRRITQAGNSPLASQRVMDFVVAIAMGAMVGGRLGYCAFYEPSLLWEFEGALPYWGLLKLNKGGMASHGGMLGVVVAIGWFARRHRLPLAHLLDLNCFGAPLGLLFGRLANFINGELYGRACDPSMPLAVKFPQELNGQPLDLNQLAQLTDAAALVNTEPSTWQRLLMEWVNGDQATSAMAYNQIRGVLTDIIHRVPSSPAMAEALAPVLTPRHPSQLYAGVTEGVIVMAVLVMAWTKPRKPLIISSLFAITYALMRIVNEQFRLPDSQFIAGDGQLPLITRGQMLSVGLLVAGVIGLIWAIRSKAQPLGGWRPQAPAPAPGSNPAAQTS